MNRYRLRKWIAFVWLMAAGAVTLVASLCESHYVGQMRAHSEFAASSSVAELYEKRETATRVKQAALVAFVCALPLAVLSWIYGKKPTPSQEL